MKMEWIKCSDRLPESNVEVFVFQSGKGFSVFSLNTSDRHPCWIFKSLEPFNFHYEDYWSPLPNPPKPPEN
jgi:hypothetical protein